MANTMTPIEKRAIFYGPENPFPGASEFDPDSLLTPLEVIELKRELRKPGARERVATDLTRTALIDLAVRNDNETETFDRVHMLNAAWLGAHYMDCIHLALKKENDEWIKGMSGPATLLYGLQSAEATEKGVIHG